VADLRQKFPMLGIVVIGENISEAAQEKTLHDGADYFLHQPVREGLLLATIRSFLRRLHILQTPAPGNTEAWTLYRRNGTLVSPHNERLALSDKECAVLTTLFLSPHFPVSAEHLMHALNITAEIIDPHRIDTIIYRIRKKLAQLAHTRFEIRNIYGRGFICVAMKEGAAFYVWDG
jgi:DNA-binding response OmpR family regulator